MSHLSETTDRHAQQDNDALMLALANVLGTSEGRELYRWIGANSHVFDSAPQDGTERWLGWREFGLYLLDTMRRANLRACHIADEEAAHERSARWAELENAARMDERERNDPLPETSNHKD
jgi:hypothetical protein